MRQTNSEIEALGTFQNGSTAGRLDIFFMIYKYNKIKIRTIVADDTYVTRTRTETAPKKTGGGIMAIGFGDMSTVDSKQF